jgi:hypothetical protein
MSLRENPKQSKRKLGDDVIVEENATEVHEHDNTSSSTNKFESFITELIDKKLTEATDKISSIMVAKKSKSDKLPKVQKESSSAETEKIKVVSKAKKATKFKPLIVIDDIQSPAFIFVKPEQNTVRDYLETTVNKKSRPAVIDLSEDSPLSSVTVKWDGRHKNKVIESMGMVRDFSSINLSEGTHVFLSLLDANNLSIFCLQNSPYFHLPTVKLLLQWRLPRTTL